MSAITLPTSAIKPIDHSRQKLISQLEAYLEFKRSKLTNEFDKANCVLPFTSEYGLCAGISAYWAYMKRTGAEGKFIYQLEHLLEWQPKDMAKGATEDPIIETIFNAISILQFDAQLRDGVNEYDVHNTFKLFLSDMHEQVAEPELSFTFVFTAESLAKFIREYFRSNKMIRISNLYHTTFMIMSGDKYHFFDPESTAGPIAIANPAQLANAILKAFQDPKFDNTNKAINITVFDLQEVTSDPYPELNEFVKTFLMQSNARDIIANNPEIFDLAIRHRQLKPLIEYSLFKGYRNGTNDTPLEIAVRTEHYREMLELLIAGADPYEPISDGATLWLLAVTNKRTEAIILLLAFGIEIDKDEIKHLRVCYSQADIKDVFGKAIALNKKLLNLQDIELSTASDHDIVAWLRNNKLKVQLGHKISELTLNVNGERLTGKDALGSVAKYFRETKGNDIYSCAQNTEIYLLLKFFKANKFRFQGSKELLNIINKSVNEIKKISEPTLNDLIKIEIILEELHALAQQPKRMNMKKMYVRHKAATAEKSILRYLEEKLDIKSISEQITQRRLQQHLLPRNNLFFTPDSATDTSLTYKDIAPFLKLRA